MTAPRRELKITYGSYVVGAGQAKRHIDGPVVIEDNHDSFSVEFTMVIAATTGPSDLETEVTAARSAFRTPFQDTKVELVDPDTVSSVQGTLLSALTTSGSRTAVNTVATMSSPREIEGASARSWVFEVRIEGGRTASYDAANLRADFAYQVDYSPSRRRTLTVTGTYTATTSALSLATYQANIATKVATITSALTGDWATVPGSESFEVDKNDHTCTFTQQFREIITPESSGTTDNTSIVVEELRITATNFGTQGDANESRLQELSLTLVAHVDIDQTKDIQGFWAGTLEPFCRQNLRDAAATSSLAVMTIGPEYDESENVIRAQMTALALTGGQFIERVVTFTDDTDYAQIFRDYWPDSPSNDPLNPDGETQVYFQTKVILRTVETRTREVGRKNPASAGAPVGGGLGFAIAPQFPGRGVFGIGAELSLSFGGSGTGPRRGGQAVPGANISGGGFLIRRTERLTPLTLGDKPDQIDVTDRTVTEVYRIVKAPTGGGGGGGQSATRAGTRTRT